MEAMHSPIVEICPGHVLANAEEGEGWLVGHLLKKDAENSTTSHRCHGRFWDCVEGYNSRNRFGRT